jgi:two-component system, oxyanion-binding sensor
MDRLTIGYLPLLDAAPLIIAREEGFAATEGLDLTLARETSWANIRDKLSLGLFEAAHMLAPMALASQAGLDHWRVPFIAPMALGQNGNGIAVSNALYADLLGVADASDLAQPLPAGEALRQVVRARQSAEAGGVTFRTVYPFSSHTYQLRHWLKVSGLDPARDVAIEVLPPSLMTDALKAGLIDGFCAGAPWPDVAAAAGVGRQLFPCQALWPQAPEKLLALRQAWANDHQDLTRRLVRAVAAAARWCDVQENWPILARRLASPSYLDMPAAPLATALGSSGLRFWSGGAAFPWSSQALWLASHMMAAGHLRPGFSRQDILAVYRPDLFRAALPDASLPATDTWLDGADAFDGVPFDPADPDAYAAYLARAGK